MSRPRSIIAVLAHIEPLFTVPTFEESGNGWWMVSSVP
jgi:hypothetical protein